MEGDRTGWNCCQRCRTDPDPGGRREKRKVGQKCLRQQYTLSEFGKTFQGALCESHLSEESHFTQQEGLSAFAHLPCSVIDWYSPREAWPQRKHSNEFQKTAAGAVGELCSSQSEIRSVHFHNFYSGYADFQFIYLLIFAMWTLN